MTTSSLGRAATRILRMLGAACFMALAWLTWTERTGYRGYEATAAGAVAGIATRSHAIVNRSNSTFFVNVGKPHVFGVVVTPQCTSAVATIAVLVVLAVTVVASRFTLRRILFAGLAAAGLFFVMNLFRLVVIAFASDHWGLVAGYHWSHVWVGTFVTVFAGGSAAALYIAVLGGRARPGRRRTAGTGIG
jgi:exosortase/archaeosortase family protein